MIRERRTSSEINVLLSYPFLISFVRIISDSLSICFLNVWQISVSVINEFLASPDRNESTNFNNFQ